MTLNEVRKKYLDYFSDKGHEIIPSSRLVPENDPTTLFTSSGMQPLLQYFLGEVHPKGKRITDSQKCFRADDIEEVGDNRHTTFFEMLGNWSFGDYFKQEQLPWIFEFLTKEIGLEPENLYVTVFSGDSKNNIPKDSESVEVWKKIFKQEGIEAKDVELLTEEKGGELGMQDGRIFYYDAGKNWWSRSGTPENMPAGEPGGTNSEVFYDFKTEHDKAYGEYCHPNCDCGRFVEIGNSVFMEYVKKEDGTFGELPNKNVDFGGGLERITAASNRNSDVFSIDVFSKMISEIEKVTSKKYSDEESKKAFRIIVDHIRAAIFMIFDGVLPSNTEQGYFVRRLIRRSAVKIRTFSTPHFFALGTLAYIIADVYRESYPALHEKVDFINDVITEEERKFRETLEKGLKEFNKLSGDDISGHDAFILFSSYGFPLELTLELAEEKGVSVDEDEFKKEMAKHQELSRSGSEQKFKGGLADSSEKTTMLHTTTHLMLAGLRKYLGDSVHQAGSNITEERTRFDLTHGEKVERDILDKVEEYVNEAISKKCDVVMEQMNKEDAKNMGVEGSFWEKYPDVVNVYSVKCDDGTVYSSELCGGPHVSNTGDIKGTFKIKKEQASSAGVRRIKAVLE